MVRKFEEWWNTVPADLKQKARQGDEKNKPLLNEINYVLLHLHLAGKHDVKPSHEELKDWLHSGQVDAIPRTGGPGAGDPGGGHPGGGGRGGGGGGIG